MIKERSFPWYFSLFITFALITFAQPSDVISRIEIKQAISNQPIEIRADLFNASEINSVFIAFKTFGETEFTRREMEIRSSAAFGVIPAEFAVPPSIEYYLLISMLDGELRTYPFGSPDQTPPERISISERTEFDDGVLILTPSPGEKVAQEELLITLSFINAKDDIDIKSTRLFLGFNDITEYALFAEDLIIFSGFNYPEKISMREQLIKIEIYDSLGNLKNTKTRSFTSVSSSYLLAMEDQFNYNIDLKGETRNENFNDESTWYNNIDARFKGNYNDLKVDAKIYATSEEKNYRQPQNRYSAKISTDWFDLSFGDSYPTYPELILSGKRVRGFDAGIYLGFFSLQASYGEITREIEGTLLQTYPVDSTSALLQSDVIEIDQSKYGQPFGRVALGEYSRNLLAIRPSFNAGETFQFGLTLLKSGDDKSSIEFGKKPKENLVLGTDLRLRFDNSRIEIKGEAAMSFQNSDISTGTLSDAQIDTVFGGNGPIDIDPDIVKNFKSIFGKFMDINQFFGPWNPEELSSLAAEASLGLNYFNNNIRAKYIYRGNDYVSFGQSFLRTDVAGFNIVDRIRMLNNKVFLSLGYERLQDNLQETKNATTTFQTINSSISIYPGEGIPNFTLGFARYDNSNDLSITDSTYLFSAIDDGTNKFYAQISHNFIWEIPHKANLYLSTSKRDDNSLRKNNTSNFSFSFNLRSEWNNYFTTHSGVTYYTSESAALPYEYSTVYFGVGLLLLENKLELTATVSPSFGDFERQALDLVANYKVIDNFLLSLQVRLYRIPDVSTNSIIGLITRYSL